MDDISLMGAVFLLRRRHLGELLRDFGITLKQLQLIRIARRRGSVSPSEAALEMFCDRPTATVIVRNCIDRGWLRQRRAQRDRRSRSLALSGAGEELIDRIDRMLAARPDGQPLDILGTDEAADFHSALERVLARASELYGGELDELADPR